ncbi:MAG: glucoamylase family protein [Bacteroidales bacterium]
MNLKFCLFLLILFSVFSCKKENTEPLVGMMQIAYVKVGTVHLDFTTTIENVPVDNNILIKFNSILDTGTVDENVHLKNEGNQIVTAQIQFNDNNQTIVLIPEESLINNQIYTIEIGDGIKSINKETFPGLEVLFKTIPGSFKIDQIKLNSIDFNVTSLIQNIDYKNINIEIQFSEPLDPDNYKSYFSLSGNAVLVSELSESDKKVTIQNSGNLEDLKKYIFTISSNLKSINGFIFTGFSNSFYTALDSTYKFPEISDDELLELIQKQTFKYFWDFGHPTSGLARERNTSGDIVTTGGSGFGIMSMIVAMERNFITRSDGLARIETIVDFLASADRFHGAWPHWMNGVTGKVVPFSTKDNGGDLVETSFLVQGLLAFRQYLNPGVPAENSLIAKINTLWHEVDWDWYRDGQNVLHWHWSPNYGFEMNFELRGYYEAMITYILATASPTHGIATNLYHEGWCRNGGIKNGKTFYGYVLPIGYDYGGPLFFAHYSFLGLDPRNLQDDYANYWTQNTNHSLINWSYCKANPKNYPGYSEDCWGLTSSDNKDGYNAHQPTNDLGVISPTAAISSLPYCPEQSMKAIRHFYYRLGDKLWGSYGFYDAFDINQDWWASSTLAIDQGPEIVMIENYRTGLLWNLFMSCPEITNALDDLGFTY